MEEIADSSACAKKEEDRIYRRKQGLSLLANRPIKLGILESFL